MLSVLPTVAVNLRNVFVMRSSRAAADGDGSLAVALTRWIPLLLLNASAALWISLSPSNILAKAPRLLLWGFIMMFAKLTMQVMLAHLTAAPYRPFGKTVGMALFLLSHYGYLVYSGVSKLSDGIIEELLVWELFLLSLVSFGHLVVHAIWEVSAALGIRVFVIDVAKARRMVKEELDAKAQAKAQAKTAKAVKATETATAAAAEGPNQSQSEAKTKTNARSKKSPRATADLSADDDDADADAVNSGGSRSRSRGRTAVPAAAATNNRSASRSRSRISSTKFKANSSSSSSGGSSSSSTNSDSSASASAVRARGASRARSGTRKTKAV